MTAEVEKTPLAALASLPSAPAAASVTNTPQPSVFCEVLSFFLLIALSKRPTKTTQATKGGHLDAVRRLKNVLLVPRFGEPLD